MKNLSRSNLGIIFSKIINLSDGVEKEATKFCSNNRIKSSLIFCPRVNLSVLGIFLCRLSQFA